MSTTAPKGNAGTVVGNNILNINKATLQKWLEKYMNDHVLQEDQQVSSLSWQNDSLQVTLSPRTPGGGLP